MNFEKGKYINMDMRGADGVESALEIINERAKDGVFFVGTMPSVFSNVVEAIFWKPEMFWFKPSEKTPSDESKVIVVFFGNDSTHKATYIDGNWLSKHTYIFDSSKIRKWSYYEES